MEGESCCTCARLLTTATTAAQAAGRHDPASEKPTPPSSPLQPEDHRRPACCGRVICGACIRDNARFAAYCPYCQISTTTGEISALPLPPPGPKEPPSYHASVTPGGNTRPHPLQPPPAYTATATATSSAHHQHHPEEKSSSSEGGKDRTTAATTTTTGGENETVVHFLRQPHDTIISLSLQYGVTPEALRRANRLPSDGDALLAARRTVLIPGAATAGGGSRSPRPPGGEEAEHRERAIRRWMLRCRVHDYDVALLYLGQAAGDLDAAVARYQADEEWERAHPLEARRRGKDTAVGGSGGGGGLGRSRGWLW